MPFVALKETLEKVLKGYKLSGDIEAYKIFALWDDIVGRKMADHATPVSIKEKTLFVEVDSPLWLSQIKYMKGDILGKVDGRIKRGALKDLRFYLKIAQ